VAVDAGFRAKLVLKTIRRRRHPDCSSKLQILLYQTYFSVSYSGSKPSKVQNFSDLRATIPNLLGLIPKPNK